MGPRSKQEWTKSCEVWRRGGKRRPGSPGLMWPLTGRSRWSCPALEQVVWWGRIWMGKRVMCKGWGGRQNYPGLWRVLWWPFDLLCRPCLWKGGVAQNTPEVTVASGLWSYTEQSAPSEFILIESSGSPLPTKPFNFFYPQNILLSGSSPRDPTVGLLVALHDIFFHDLCTSSVPPTCLWILLFFIFLPYTVSFLDPVSEYITAHSPPSPLFSRRTVFFWCLHPLAHLPCCGFWIKWRCVLCKLELLFNLTFCLSELTWKLQLHHKWPLTYPHSMWDTSKASIVLEGIVIFIILIELLKALPMVCHSVRLKCKLWLSLKRQAHYLWKVKLLSASGIRAAIQFSEEKEKQIYVYNCVIHTHTYEIDMNRIRIKIGDTDHQYYRNYFDLKIAVPFLLLQCRDTARILF